INVCQIQICWISPILLLSILCLSILSYVHVCCGVCVCVCVCEWPGAWTQRVDNQAKRNIVVADDAAFREKSKLLTAMERQKWLNSYMQKLLVVNSK
uniref:Tuberoinfundibular peptide of 39 residues n=1 Tax=Electrophorus electricus TaxID=8005 RepID=A0AAY5EYF9_ELEEL